MRLPLPRYADVILPVALFAGCYAYAHLFSGLCCICDLHDTDTITLQVNVRYAHDAHSHVTLFYFVGYCPCTTCASTIPLPTYHAVLHSLPTCICFGWLYSAYTDTVPFTLQAFKSSQPSHTVYLIGIVTYYLVYCVLYYTLLLYIVVCYLLSQFYIVVHGRLRTVYLLFAHTAGSAAGRYSFHAFGCPFPGCAVTPVTTNYAVLPHHHHHYHHTAAASPFVRLRFILPFTLACAAHALPVG